MQEKERAWAWAYPKAVSESGDQGLQARHVERQSGASGAELVRQPQRHLIASTDSDAAFVRLFGTPVHFPACAAGASPCQKCARPTGGCLALWGNKTGNVLALLLLVRDQYQYL